MDFNVSLPVKLHQCFSFPLRHILKPCMFVQRLSIQFLYCFSFFSLAYFSVFPLLCNAALTISVSSCNNGPMNLKAAAFSCIAANAIAYSWRYAWLSYLFLQNYTFIIIHFLVLTLSFLMNPGASLNLYPSFFTSENQVDGHWLLIMLFHRQKLFLSKVASCQKSTG